MLDGLLSLWKKKQAEETRTAREQYLTFEEKIVAAEVAGRDAKIDADEFVAICESVGLTPAKVRERVGLLVEAKRLEPQLAEAWKIVDSLPGQQAHHDAEAERVNQLIKTERAKLADLYNKMLADTGKYGTVSTLEDRQRAIEFRLDELLPPA